MMNPPTLPPQSSLEGIIDFGDSNGNPVALGITMSNPPSLQHQSSLEGIIDFSHSEHVAPDEHMVTERKFYQIMELCEDLSGKTNTNERQGYDRYKLVRYTYEYAIDSESQSKILELFSEHVNTDAKDISLKEEVERFGNYLWHNFFLPLRASSKSSTRGSAESSRDWTPAPSRDPIMQTRCMERDDYRCVVSHKFDMSEEGIKRIKEGSANGTKLEIGELEDLQVAHILSYSLMNADGKKELTDAKKNALDILNRFSNGARNLIEGIGVNDPSNGITLTYAMHNRFDNFQIFFESAGDGIEHKHKYYTKSFCPTNKMILDHYGGSTEARNLNTHPTINPPHPKLLKVHRAIAHILYLSAAGEYIEEILDDWKRGFAKTDGSTALAELVQIGLNGVQLSQLITV